MRPARGICPVCGREFSLRWNYSVGLSDPGGWSLRRHRADGRYCDGEQMNPVRITQTFGA